MCTLWICKPASVEIWSAINFLSSLLNCRCTTNACPVARQTNNQPKGFHGFIWHIQKLLSPRKPLNDNLLLHPLLSVFACAIFVARLLKHQTVSSIRPCQVDKTDRVKTDQGLCWVFVSTLNCWNISQKPSVLFSISTYEVQLIISDVFRSITKK